MTEDFANKFKKMEQEVIVPYLREIFGMVNSACCLYHMIEQGEDIYTYLVNGADVISLEVSRVDGSIIEDDLMTVEAYAKMLKGRQCHRYLRELLKLSQRDDFQV